METVILTCHDVKARDCGAKREFVHSRSPKGQIWPIGGAGPANEGYMLIGAGIPTLPGFGPTGGNAHAPDEWVEIASLTTTMATFAGIICDYLATMFAM